jgi:hypothetical protein
MRTQADEQLPFIGDVQHFCAKIYGDIKRGYLYRSPEQLSGCDEGNCCKTHLAAGPNLSRPVTGSRNYTDSPVTDLNAFIDEELQQTRVYIAGEATKVAKNLARKSGNPSR